MPANNIIQGALWSHLEISLVLSNFCDDIFLQLLGLGTALLDNVDPNPENYVCAGVIQTKNQQVGCLLRLEPNAQAQVKP